MARTKVTLSTPCPACGTCEAWVYGPHKWPQPRWEAYCDCYDGAPDAGYQCAGVSEDTRETAIRDLDWDRCCRTEVGIMRAQRTKYTTVYIEREIDDDNYYEVAVECAVYPGEPQWFNAMEGVGHPGSGPEVEILSAATRCGEATTLTDKEIELAELLAIESED